MTCTCGHDGSQHAWNASTQYCQDHNCYCMQFTAATPENPIISEWHKYVIEMERITDQVTWILKNLPHTRDMKNRDFVDFYMTHIGAISRKDGSHRKVDYEGVRRAKQKVVAVAPEIYGPTSGTVQREKALKQTAMEEYARA